MRAHIAYINYNKLRIFNILKCFCVVYVVTKICLITTEQEIKPWYESTHLKEV